jgi:hypothetical protein
MQKAFVLLTMLVLGFAAVLRGQVNSDEHPNFQVQAMSYLVEAPDLRTTRCERGGPTVGLLNAVEMGCDVYAVAWPPRERSRRLFVYNIVETDQVRYLIACRSDGPLSGCFPLLRGQELWVKVKAGKMQMWTGAPEASNKPLVAEFRIIQVEPKSR